MITLYHGSNVKIEAIRLDLCSPYKDFGKGFYLTTLYEQAKKYAMRFLLRKQKAYINEYILDDDIHNFNIKIFKSYDEEWLDYVGKCRKGIQTGTYDIVEGGIANDKVFNTIDL